MAGEERGYIPIPPFSIPETDGDFSLVGDAIAIDCFSISVRSNWWLGCWARIDTELVSLGVPALSERFPCPVNRGARLILIPDWARAGFQVALELPFWIEELRIEVYLHDPS